MAILADQHRLLSPVTRLLGLDPLRLTWMAAAISNTLRMLFTFTFHEQ